MRRRALASLVALVCLAWSSASRAQAPGSAAPAHARVKLEYRAPELSCPDRDAFAAAIATRLGYDAVAPQGDVAGDAKTLAVSYRREGTALRVTLRLSNAAQTAIEAEKSLSSETGACDELGAAAAFAAAILLDPRAMFPQPKGPAAPSGEPLESNAPGTWPWYEPRSPLPPPPPSPPPPETPLIWRVGAGLTACVGCAPQMSAGATLFLGVAKGHLGLDLGVRADLPVTSSNAAPGGRTTSSSVVLGELYPHLRLGPARLGVLASVGSLFGSSNEETQASLFAAAGARVAVEWVIVGPLFVRAALDGSVVLSRVSLRVEGVELWSTPALIAGGSLGAGVQF